MKVEITKEERDMLNSIGRRSTSVDITAERLESALCTLRRVDTERHELRAKCDTLQKKYVEMGGENIRLRHIIATAPTSATIDILENSITGYRNALDAASEEIKDLEKKIKCLKNALKRLAEKNKTQAGFVETANRVVLGLCKDNSALLKQVMELKNSKADPVSGIRPVSYRYLENVTKIQQLEGINRNWADQNAITMRKIRSLQKDLDRAHAVIERFDDELEWHETFTTPLRAKCSFAERIKMSDQPSHRSQQEG